MSFLVINKSFYRSLITYIVITPQPSFDPWKLYIIPPPCRSCLCSLPQYTALRRLKHYQNCNFAPQSHIYFRQPRRQCYCRQRWWLLWCDCWRQSADTPSSRSCWNNSLDYKQIGTNKQTKNKQKNLKIFGKVGWMN